MRPLIFERDGRRIEIQPSPRVAVNDSSAHFASMRAGLGLGQIISFIVSANGAGDEFVPVLEDWQPEAMPVHVLYPANRHLSTKVRVFVDWVAELFARSECTRLLNRQVGPKGVARADIPGAYGINGIHRTTHRIAAVRADCAQPALRLAGGTQAPANPG